MNPLTRLLAGVLAVLALVGAFFFGIFILAFAVGLGLVAWVVLWVRTRWIGKQPPDVVQPSGSKSGDVIDAEYTVVSRQDEE